MILTLNIQQNYWSEVFLFQINSVQWTFYSSKISEKNKFVSQFPQKYGIVNAKMKMPCHDLLARFLNIKPNVLKNAGNQTALYEQKIG